MEVKQNGVVHIKITQSWRWMVNSNAVGRIDSCETVNIKFKFSLSVEFALSSYAGTGWAFVDQWHGDSKAYPRPA